MHEDRDDDGETGAGDKVLYLLQRMNVVNVVVMITRWFGGIHLGNDRFKHITNVAKDIILEHYPEDNLSAEIKEKDQRKSKN